MESFLALMIPIIAIVVWSPVGKAAADRLRVKAPASPPQDTARLEARVEQLENRLVSQQDELHQLRTSVDFYDQLLPAKD